MLATHFEGERSSGNATFVDAVARTHVRHTVQVIREQSRVLAKLENEGRIRIVGSMYHLAGGRLEFID